MLYPRHRQVSIVKLLRFNSIKDYTLGTNAYLYALIRLLSHCRHCILLLADKPLLLEARFNLIFNNLVVLLKGTPLEGLEWEVWLFSLNFNGDNHLRTIMLNLIETGENWTDLIIRYGRVLWGIRLRDGRRVRLFVPHKVYREISTRWGICDDRRAKILLIRHWKKIMQMRHLRRGPIDDDFLLDMVEQVVKENKKPRYRKRIVSEKDIQTYLKNQYSTDKARPIELRSLQVVTDIASMLLAEAELEDLEGPMIPVSVSGKYPSGYTIGRVEKYSYSSHDGFLRHIGLSITKKIVVPDQDHLSFFLIALLGAMAEPHFTVHTVYLYYGHLIGLPTNPSKAEEVANLIGQVVLVLAREGVLRSKRTSVMHRTAKSSSTTLFELQDVGGLYGEIIYNCLEIQEKRLYIYGAGNVEHRYAFHSSRGSIQKDLEKTHVWVNGLYLDLLLQHVVNQDNHISHYLSYPVHSKGAWMPMRVYLGERDMFQERLDNLKKVSRSGSRPVSFAWKEDLRGRIYMESIPVGIQGRKIVRPLFYFPSETPLVIKEFYRKVAIEKFYKRSFARYTEAYRHLMETLNPIDPGYVISIRTSHDIDLLWQVVYIYLNGYLSIVEVDAVCSGHQHIAGILKNQYLAELVGISPKDSSKEYQDLYETIAELAIENLPRPLIEGVNRVGARKFYKPAIIATPYGITEITIKHLLANRLRRSANAELIAWVKQNEGDGKGLWGKVVKKYMLRELKDSYIKVVGNVDQVRKDLGELVKAIPDNHLILIDGLLMNMHYQKMTRVDRKLKHKNHSYHMNMKLPYQEVDNVKIKRASWVNLIHGQDALLMAYCIVVGDLPFLPIHDCIMVTPPDVQACINLGQVAYTDMYGDIENPLAEVIKWILTKHPSLSLECRRISAHVDNTVLTPTSECFKSELGIYSLDR